MKTIFVEKEEKTSVNFFVKIFPPCLTNRLYLCLMQMTSNPIRVSFVGSGNVATRLCYAFRDAGVEIFQLLSNSSSGKELSEVLDMELITTPKELKPVDVVLLCIKDDALIPDYLSQFPKNLLLCHSSGSVSMEVFENHKRAAVFYPLQTLSKTKEVEFENIPICLEAREKADLKLLTTLAKTISRDVRVVDSKERLQIHLAAVFVSNFANHLYKIAGDLLENSNIDFDILKPLIAETAAKVQMINPLQAQTGPALRHDEEVIKKHIDLLNPYPDYQKIYKLFSKSIAENN